MTTTQKQIECIKTLLPAISNNSTWNNLKHELINYQNYLQRQQQQQRPRKPPLQLKFYANNNNNNDNDDSNNNKKKSEGPTKPPMKLKQAQKLNNNPLLRLFIRLPPKSISNNNKIETKEIIIWNDDENEIEDEINTFCHENSLQHYKQYHLFKKEIKNSILSLLESKF